MNGKFIVIVAVGLTLIYKRSPFEREDSVILYVHSRTALANHQTVTMKRFLILLIFCVTSPLVRIYALLSIDFWSWVVISIVNIVTDGHVFHEENLKKYDLQANADIYDDKKACLENNGLKESELIENYNGMICQLM